MSNGINNAQQDSTGHGRTQSDAQEFGQHVRQGGWRLGLLVARNVEIGNGSGERTDIEPRNNRTEVKVSGNEFARLSGVSRPKVLRYLEAWGRAAEQGIVPAADTLTPGTEIELDVDTLPSWSQFYEAVNRTTNKAPEGIPPSLEQITEAVKANPMIAEAVAEHIEPTSESVTKAMRSNPEIAKAARDEAWDITREKALERSSTTPSKPHDDPSTKRDSKSDVLALTLSLRKARQALNDAVEIAQLTDARIPKVVELTGELRMRLDAIDSAMTSGSFDEQLADLLDEEAGR